MQAMSHPFLLALEKDVLLCHGTMATLPPAAACPLGLPGGGPDRTCRRPYGAHRCRHSGLGRSRREPEYRANRFPRALKRDFPFLPGPTELSYIRRASRAIPACPASAVTIGSAGESSGGRCIMKQSSGSPASSLEKPGDAPSRYPGMGVARQGVNPREATDNLG